jgi:uncharacterized protein with FMN-binding domain
MKKITLTVWFLLLFGFYVAYERTNPSQAIVLAPSSQSQTPLTTSNTGTGTVSSTPPPIPNPTPTATPTQKPLPKPAPAPAPVPTPKPIGQYKDGTYTGPAADAYYGNVQVEAIVQGGKIADVKFLDYPQTHQTSVYINSQAMPYLTQEAIQAQNANVNIVSGATLTSQAFIQSLASALTQAKNS